MLTSPARNRRRPAWAALVVAVAALALASCTAGAVAGTGTTAGPTSSTTGNAGGQDPTAGTTPPGAPTTSEPPPKVVHVASLESDGVTYGIGMPIVLFLTPAPTDSTAFTKAVTVTVDGQPADGAWFWSQPTAEEKRAGTVEAHYRTRDYWPANSSIHVDLPVGGLSAGKGLVYGDKLTSLDFKIGDAHISEVDGASKTMKVTSNGKTVNTFEVSLGKASTPTFNGVKVVMQKGENAPSGALRPNGAVTMQGPGYGPELVSWSVRITRSGEYVHAAPWNSRIGQASTSNGCTNLTTADAKWFYQFALVGDVVTYDSAGGTKMPSWDGFGDWNVPWTLWKQGGALLNH